MKVKSSKVFSVVDLQNGYFNILVKHNDCHKTAFILPWDKYHWKRILPGLLGAPFTFTKAIVSTFPDLPFVVVYFDDILIFSGSILKNTLNI